MVRCDVCQSRIDITECFALLPDEVLCNKNYWKRAFTQQWASLAQVFSQDSGMVASLVKKQIEYNTAWIVCPDCADYFHFERKEARQRILTLQKAPETMYPRADEGEGIHAAFSALKDLS